MPSRLRTSKIFTPLAYKGEDSALALQSQETNEWMGYCPDIKSEALGWGAGTTTRFVARGEVLQPDWGFKRSNAYKFGEDATGNHAGKGIAADANHPQTITFLGSWGRGSTTDLMLLTAVDGSTTWSHLFRRTGSGASYTWTEVMPTGDFDGTFQLIDQAANVGALAISTSQIAEGCTYAGGSPAKSDVAGVQVNTTMGAQESVYILATGDHREILFIRSGDPNHYDYFIDDAVYTGSPDPFKAASVASFDGRACYWNTTENGTNFPLRFRHSIVGDPANLVGIGSGYIDASDLSGRGTAMRSCGNVLYGFATGGIVRFVPTPFTSTDDLSIFAPFDIQYTSQTRGLWSPGCLCRWGEDSLFGIFTDGWFFLDSNGTFSEAGLTQVGNVRVHKWKQSFYALLNKSATYAVRCIPDYFDNLIRIYFPTGTSTVVNACWIYDVPTDRAWPDPDYLSSSGFPTAGVTVPSTSGAATLGTLGGTLGSHPFPLGYYGNFQDLETTYIGTATGNLYEFVKTGYDREDASAVAHIPQLTLETNLTNLGSSLLEKLPFRVGMIYQAFSTGSVNLILFSNDGSGASENLDVILGPYPHVATLYPDTIGRLFAFYMSFTGSLHVHTLLHQFYISAGDSDGLT